MRLKKDPKITGLLFFYLARLLLKELKKKLESREKNLADLEQGNEVLTLMLSNKKINPSQIEPISSHTQAED